MSGRFKLPIFLILFWYIENPKKPFFVSALSKRMDATLSHTQKILKYYRSIGICKYSDKVKDSRKRPLILTKKGIEIHEKVCAVVISYEGKKCD